MALRSSKCDENRTIFEKVVDPPQCLREKMFVKEKRLLGAGPSNPPEAVLKSLSNPMMGHLHPETLQVTKYIMIVLIGDRWHIVLAKYCLSNDSKSYQYGFSGSICFAQTCLFVIFFLPFYLLVESPKTIRNRAGQ